MKLKPLEGPHPLADMDALLAKLVSGSIDQARAHGNINIPAWGKATGVVIHPDPCHEGDVHDSLMLGGFECLDVVGAQRAWPYPDGIPEDQPLGLDRCLVFRGELVFIFQADKRAPDTPTLAWVGIVQDTALMGGHWVNWLLEPPMTHLSWWAELNTKRGQQPSSIQTLKEVQLKGHLTGKGRDKAVIIQDGIDLATQLNQTREALAGAQALADKVLQDRLDMLATIERLKGDLAETQADLDVARAELEVASEPTEDDLADQALMLDMLDWLDFAAQWGDYDSGPRFRIRLMARLQARGLLCQGES